MKYRKKPVVIDAVQWTGKNHREMFDFLTENTFKEESMTVSRDHFYIDHSKVEGGLVIKTSEGDMIVSVSDYVIKEPFDKERMYYPCKEDIFHQTYEYAEVFEPISYQPPVTFTQLHSNEANMEELLNEVTAEEMERADKEMKQSSIDWFVKETWKLRVQLDNKEVTLGEYSTKYYDLYQHADTMHKEEITNAWDAGYDEIDRATASPLKYYEETFNTKEK